MSNCRSEWKSFSIWRVSYQVFERDEQLWHHRLVAANTGKQAWRVLRETGRAYESAPHRVSKIRMAFALRAKPGVIES
jgi:hypothetical protein